MKSRNPSTETVLGWIKQGYGQGQGLDYKPFFYVRDVPSKGRSTILKGLKIPRTHHYLSDIEYHYHILAEFSDVVTEIREQYALLPLAETQAMADRLHIRHPIYARTGAPHVLTSDLVLTLRKDKQLGLMTISCKAANDIDPKNPSAKRTLEKLLLEKAYWENRNVPWHLVTEKMLPQNKIHNLDFFRVTMASREQAHLNTIIGDFLRVTHAIWDECVCLNDLLTATSARLHIEEEESFYLLGRAIWSKALRVDLDHRKFLHDGPLPALLPHLPEAEVSC